MWCRSGLGTDVCEFLVWVLVLSGASVFVFRKEIRFVLVCSSSAIVVIDKPTKEV